MICASRQPAYRLAANDSGRTLGRLFHTKYERIFNGCIRLGIRVPVPAGQLPAEDRTSQAVGGVDQNCRPVAGRTNAHGWSRRTATVIFAKSPWTLPPMPELHQTREEP